MNSRERMQKTLAHTEPDRVPYDLAGTTVTAITKNAYRNAMSYRGLSTDYQYPEIDPISQIVQPIEENLVILNVDTRRIGAERIPGYAQNKQVSGRVERVTDFYGCEWIWDPGKDLYFNQLTHPLEKFETLSEGIPSLHRVDLDTRKLPPRQI